MTDFTTSAPLPEGLPTPDPDSAGHGRLVYDMLRDQVAASPDRMMPFDDWMHQALYAPGLGYYAAGSTKLGVDFTTAPELSPLFGLTLARQIQQVLAACDAPNILEFGAGSGALAEAVLDGLQALGIDAHYTILEVSPDLRERQQQRLEHFGDQVQWRDEVPDSFCGCVLANEVLDAMPVKLFRFDQPSSTTDAATAATQAPTLVEAMVGVNDAGHFTWRHRPAGVPLQEAVAARMPALPGYQSEINLQAEAWVRGMGQWLKQGAALLIDYGFPQREYYHPQRSQGTLMCHFRHHSHSDPLVLPGLQDITAHVDFTAMADAALEGGLQVLGYTSQANFLLNADLMVVLGESDQSPQHLSAVQKLLSEAEMGELFKVLAIGTELEVDYPLRGFTRNDRRHAL